MFLSRFKIFFLALILCAIVSPVGRAHAASLSFTPSSDVFKQQCSSKIDIILDTQGVSSNAADAVVLFNPAEVDILDQNASIPGIQIKTGTVYELYAGNMVNVSQSKILLTAFSVVGDFNGSGLLGSIFFKTKPGVSATSFSFDFTPGSSVDSNVADGTGNDVLSTVNTGSYTFIVSPCVPDTQAPILTNSVPSNGATGVALGSNVSFHLEDNQSGVDLSTVNIQLHTAAYLHDSPQVTITGLPLDYTLTINPDADFPSGTEIVMVVTAKDLVGNTMSPKVISFNKPPQPVAPPTVVSPVCGNGVVETGEACEPPGGFGCSVTCQADVLQCLTVDPQLLETLATSAANDGTLTPEQIASITDLKSLEALTRARAEQTRSVSGGVTTTEIVNFVTKGTETVAKTLGCTDACVKVLFGPQQEHWYIPVGLLLLLIILIGLVIIFVLHRLAGK